MSEEKVKERNAVNGAAPVNNGSTVTFGEISPEPAMEAIDGIRFDFCDGLRVSIPENGKSYRLRFNDLDTKSLIYDVVAPPGTTAVSHKKYFIRFRLVISDAETDKLLFMHDFDARDREVTVRFPVHTLGDTIAWFSYVEQFQQKHQCKLICVVSSWFAGIVKKQYPQIRFITREEAHHIPAYANYNVGIFDVGNTTHQVFDHRYVGLHRLAAYILGVDPEAETPPRFDLSARKRIKGKYVCIAVQSTSLAKYWNHPGGWNKVTAFLKEAGYRVLCIDRDRVCTKPGCGASVPDGAEDFTGDRPLQERIDLIKNADFFIGLSSGLSWLAWGCQVPVVLISGFTAPWNEFKTPYRVMNFNACHSCWNDFKAFDLHDFWNCPRLSGTAQRFECSAMITAEQVIDVIQKIINKDNN